MTENNPISTLNETSPSVQKHIELLQATIERMASNSSSAKTWCITLVSAVLVTVAGKEKPDFVLIALIPTFLFLALDTYYLALEKGFRNSYSSFVKELHKNLLTSKDLYHIRSKGDQTKLQIEAFKSFSVWGFYSLLGVLIFLVRWLAFV